MISVYKTFKCQKTQHSKTYQKEEFTIKAICQNNAFYDFSKKTNKQNNSCKKLILRAKIIYSIEAGCKEDCRVTRDPDTPKNTSHSCYYNFCYTRFLLF